MSWGLADIMAGIALLLAVVVLVSVAIANAVHRRERMKAYADFMRSRLRELRERDR